MTQSSAERRSESILGDDDKPSPWPDWSGDTVVCVATGPSLTAEDVQRVHGRRMLDRCKVIAINEAGLTQYKPLAAPWADILYAADQKWWRHYVPEFYGLRVSGEPVPRAEQNGQVFPAIHTVPLKMLERGELMPREPGSVVSGGHSGFQALGLALTLGAARILLLGYDCGGPQRNCHADRPAHFQNDANMNRWIQCYNRVPHEWPMVTVINCSMISRIAAFNKLPLEDAICA